MCGRCAEQVLFLLLFVAYFVIGVVALAVDAEAMDAECAADSWIWLYALLVIVIPTSLGFVLSLVEVKFYMWHVVCQAVKPFRWHPLLPLLTRPAC